MKVQMQSHTFYNGPLKPGDVVEVPNAVAIRWAKRGIASTSEEITDVEFINVDKAGAAKVEVENPYSGMKAKDLYELCVSKGIEAEPKKSIEYYTELLIASEVEQVQDSIEE